MRHVLFIALICFILFPILGNAQIQSRKCSPAKKYVTLTIRSETWREDKPYDISINIRQQFTNAQITVVDDSTKFKDAVILADYSETKGYKYVPAGQGTDIELRLRILEPNDLKLLGEVKIYGGTGTSVTFVDLYHEALHSLLNNKKFVNLGYIVSATLGDRCSAEQLRPLAIKEPELVVSLLDGIGWMPTKSKDKSLLGIARAIITKDYNIIDSMDKNQADQLLMVINNCLWYNNNELLFAHSVRTLARVSERKAIKPLMNLVRDMAYRYPTGCDTSKIGCRDFVIMIVSFADALGALGDKFTMIDLEDLSNKGYFHPDLILAMKRAATSIRIRLRK